MAGTPKTKAARVTCTSDFLEAVQNTYLADFVDSYLKVSSFDKSSGYNLSHGDEDSLFDITRKGLKEYLDFVSSSQPTEYASRFAPLVQAQRPLQNTVVTQLIRNEQNKKQVLIDMVRRFTKNVDEAIEITTDIDKFYTNVVVQLVGFVQGAAKESWDVNEREQLIEKLQRSEELYKQAQAITHVGNWDWDISANEVHWTDELYRIYGMEPQSIPITLESFLERVHPLDVQAVMDQTRRTMEERVPGNFYHRIILPNGQEKILHARSEALVGADGKVHKIIGTSQDVTIEKQLERKIKDSQNFIEKIANATPCLIALYNIHTGKYEFVSAGLTKLLGYQPEQVLQQGIAFFTEKIHPDDLRPLMEKNGEALARANGPMTSDDSVIVEFQYRLRHANGEYRWLHTFGTVFDRNDQNQVEHVLNISLDITESVNASEKLRAKTIELEQSNANLEEFAFVVSHDLKEPLRKIITFSDRLSATERKAISADGKSLLDKITNSTIRMQQMINDLLSLSVISADKSFSKSNLKSLLHEVLITFEHKIEEKNARVEISELPDANVVPSQIRQLFQNLLSNAFKFSRQNVPPVITIRHRMLSPAEMKMYDASGKETFVELKIEDNGIGFDNEYGEKIFAVFQRLHERSSYEGTGIGLAICKKIVENHRGKIFAHGQSGAGATFTIVLPL